MSNSKPRNLLKSITLETKEIVIEYLQTHGATKNNTPELYEAIGKRSYRGLEDVFKYLEEKEHLLIKEKKGRAYYWRLKDKELLIEKLSQKDAISLDYAIELNKEEFDIDTIKRLKKMFQSNSKVLLGNLSISENLDNEKMNDFYNTLSYAIEHHLYLRLEFLYKLPHFTFYEVKPVKIVFANDNWYLAFEHYDREKKVRLFQFGRLAFIKKIELCKDHRYSTKNRFNPNFDKYIKFLENDVQNAMTMYGVKPQKATILATPNVARYFKADIKKALPSQKFIEERDNGSVIFSLEYTQPLEILPLIQKWMPDLIILEPDSLKQEYITKLQKSLENYS